MSVAEKRYSSCGLFELVEMKMPDPILSLVLCLRNVGWQSPKEIFHAPGMVSEYTPFNKGKHQRPDLPSLPGVGANRRDAEACNWPRGTRTQPGERRGHSRSQGLGSVIPGPHRVCMGTPPKCRAGSSLHYPQGSRHRLGPPLQICRQRRYSPYFNRHSHVVKILIFC